MFKWWIVICVFVVPGSLAYYEHASKAAYQRPLDSHESASLEQALKTLCTIDPPRCAAIEAKEVEYLVVAKPWLAYQMDRVLAFYDTDGGAVYPNGDAFIIALGQTTLEAPAALLVVLYHEQTHVLFSNPSLYATFAMRWSKEQCIDHNHVKESTQKVFSDFFSHDDSPLAQDIRAYAFQSHGNTIEDCSIMSELAELPANNS